MLLKKIGHHRPNPSNQRSNLHHQWGVTLTHITNGSPKVATNTTFKLLTFKLPT